MSARLLHGHVLDTLATLPERSVHCVVTSPPYWSLRDYELEPQIWGGDPACPHRWGINGSRHKGGPHGAGVLRDGGRGVIAAQAATKTIDTGCVCAACGAWKGSLGLEPIPDCLGWARGERCSQCYVCHIRTVFAAVQRVLRDDGTLWLNMGDCYDAGTRAQRDVSRTTKHGYWNNPAITLRPRAGLGALQRVGLAWRVALALQADGWVLRRDLVWSKTNPLPESVRGWRWERHRIKRRAGWSAECPHSSHRLDGLTMRTAHRGDGPSPGIAEWDDCPGCERCAGSDGLVLHRGAWRPTTAHEYLFLLTRFGRYYADGDAVREPASPDTHARYGRGRSSTHKYRDGGPGRQTIARTFAHMRGEDVVTDRNLRSVLTLPTQGFRDGHFATFPERLADIAILSGSSSHVCSECGAPWARVEGREALCRRPTCTHRTAPAGRSVILDPFAGSGTTGVVALRHGRDFVGIELSAAYVEMARRRVRDDAPLLNNVDTKGSAGMWPQPATG